MASRGEYRKRISHECHYCDYQTCRKGHKCKWYKKFVKKYVKRKKVQNNDKVY